MSDGLAALLLPAMAIIIIAFMFWSQRRRQNAIADLQASLHVGDDVCTTSGLFGTIRAMDDVMVTLEVAPGTRVRFDRRAIAIKVDASGRPLTGATGGDRTTDPSPTAPTSDRPNTPET